MDLFDIPSFEAYRYTGRPEYYVDLSSLYSSLVRKIGSS